MLDILLDINGDLNTPFKRGESSLQHQELLLVTDKVGFKETPNGTVGIETYLNENEFDKMVDEIRDVFTKDGMILTKISYNESTEDLNYEANYN